MSLDEIPDQAVLFIIKQVHTMPSVSDDTF